MSNVAVPTAQSHTPSGNRFMKVSDVAELMDVPVSTVYDLARQGRIVGTIRFGRHIRFEKDKLEHWLEEGGERQAAR